MSHSICIVDDDVSVREAVSALTRSAGLNTQTFASGKEFLARSSDKPPDCLVLDVCLPELDGLELQRRLAKGTPHVPIIFISGQANIPTSVRAIKAGALDFLTKPLDGEELLRAIWRAIAGVASKAGTHVSALRKVRSPAGHQQTKSDEIVGESSALRQLLCQVERVASTDSTVLIGGETGTGKELIARAIHYQSSRKAGPFVKLNCAAVPSGLLESELMGHERGAFTGAVAQRIGRFELAQNGTLFLDEIGEMPLDVQPKLLRLLQEREFERVGGSRTLRSNARVIAATNRQLDAMVAARSFREDLFYRLTVFPLDVPPLRDRRQDIPALVRCFVGRLSGDLNQNISDVSPGVLQQLTEYHWPGNVRELQNVLERAVILSRGTQLELPENWRNRRSPSSTPPAVQDLASISRAHILAVLQSTNWVIAGSDGAAVRLGMKRSTLISRMKKLGIARTNRAHGRPSLPPSCLRGGLVDDSGTHKLRLMPA